MKRHSLSQALVLRVCALLAIVALIAGCATPTPQIAEKVVTKEVTRAVSGYEAVEETVVVEGKAEEVMTTPMPTMPPQAEERAGDAEAPSLPVAYRVNRMIIKNAELSLRVADSDVAIDQVTQIAADTFGYILTARTWYENDYKYATITIGVPVDEFEHALRRLRALALKVLDENASGTDVTDQYVDLESRLRNLEATEARIRSFLDKAVTVEEALQVNQRLADITAQIEEVKGQMNYLKDRAAYSTITVHLSPEVPTPTPTPTPTVTPTPTPTPTMTPVAWRPGETFKRSTNVLGSILRTLGDLIIWLTVVFGPFVLLIGLIVWLGIRLRRRWHKPRSREKPTPEGEGTQREEAP